MKELIFPALNLILLIGFIVYKTKVPFYAFMKKRHRDVFEGLSRSKLQAATAAARKKEVESKLVNLDAERVEIAAEWTQRALEQTQLIKEGSMHVISQMRKEAGQNKAALEVTLHDDILRGFRRNVIAQAEAKIKQALSGEVHAKLNQNVVKELSAS